ncbi:Pentatricopeptide repeat (PPR) superfamily protein [Rhynchospora pubera]|uniref:Pentatricopeptide repeat (PPR) superfamily protein n=1 Tax=Rhynchospora pubera TaxID=906938 RepID=A0AAV8HLY5_9POAL|nr:Pentatricopeptide repeat (PPR) superfamily protein [Rhynchospora pubera]
MSGKATKPLASQVKKLVKQRCDAEKLQLQQFVSRFRRLLSPDITPPPSVTVLALNGILKSIAKINHPDSFPTLLSLFNRFKRARHRHRPSVSPTVHTFGLVIDSCRRMGRADLAFCVLGQSLREGCGADTIMFGSLIKGSCAAKQLGDAAKVFAKMPLLGCRPNVIIYTTLIDAFCKCGKTKTGLELSRRMAEDGSCCKPNVATYNTLIRGFCREREIAEAMKMFHEMVANRVKPNVITFSILIDGLCKNGDVKAAQKVFKEMPTYGVVPNSYSHNSLIDGFFKNGDVTAARRVFEDMSAHGVVADLHTYNILIDGLCNHGERNNALRMFEGMIAKGVVPSITTYNSLILGSFGVGDSHKAFQLYEELFV